MEVRGGSSILVLQIECFPPGRPPFPPGPGFPPMMPPGAPPFPPNGPPPGMPPPGAFPPGKYQLYVDSIWLFTLVLGAPPFPPSGGPPGPNNTFPPAPPSNQLPVPNGGPSGSMMHPDRMRMMNGGR